MTIDMAEQFLIVQGNDEGQNQKFIRDTTPTAPPTGEFRYEYIGYHGCDCHCTLEILGNLVICTEDEDNHGTSITNLSEHLATRICYQYGIDPQKLT